MAKYPVLFTKGDELLKRSIDISVMDLFFILSDFVKVYRTKRKTGNIVFAFRKKDFISAIFVKNVPLWLLRRFQKEDKWIDLKK